MFERFAPDARGAVATARQLAAEQNHCCLSTAHLLLALVVADGAVAGTLRQAGVTPELVQTSASDWLGDRGPSADVEMPFSDATKRVIEEAETAARALEDPEVREQHLLIGLLGEDQGVAFRVLLDSKADVAELREEMLSQLGSSGRSIGVKEGASAVASRPDSQIGRLLRKARNATPLGVDVGVLELLREIARTDDDPAPGELFRWLGLNAESFDGAIYVVQGGLGLPSEPAETIVDRARDLWDTDDPNLLQVVHAAVTPPCDALSTALRLEGISPLEVSADAAVAIDERRGEASAESTTTTLWSGANLLLTLLVTVLVIRSASGAWWKALLVLPVWWGHPGFGPVVGLGVATALFILVGPVAAALHAVGVGAEILQARSERAHAWPGSGARSLSLRQWRRHIQRRYARRGGRAGLMAVASLYRQAIWADFATAVRFRRVRRDIERQLMASAEASVPQQAIPVASEESVEHTEALEAVVDLRTRLTGAPRKDRGNLAVQLGQHCYTLAGFGLHEEAIEANEIVVRTFRTLQCLDPSRVPDNLAAALHHRSELVARLGNNEDAVRLESEAVTLLRPLAGDGDEYSAHLARAAHQLASGLGKLDRHLEAVEAADEAVQLRRRLFEQDSDKFRIQLLLSLELLANELLKARRPHEAVDALNRATHMRRELAADDPGRHLSHVARLLLDVGEAYQDDGAHGRSVVAMEEAVATYRAIVEDQPSHRHDLANALRRLSDALVHLFGTERGLPSLSEAVEIRRALADTSVKQRGLLAMYLERLADAFERLGSRDEQLTARRAAVDEWRTLRATSGPRDLKGLDRSLAALCEDLLAEGHLEEALTVSRDAVEAARELATTDDGFIPVLATRLRARSRVQRRLGQHEARVESLEEEVAIHREMVDKLGARERGDLAEGLRTLAAALHSVDRSGDARPIAEEAVEIYRELTTNDPDRFRFDLAKALTNASVYTRVSGSPSESLGRCNEAIDITQTLVQSDRKRFLPHLAFMLENLVESQEAVGDYAGALETIDQAFAILDEVASAGEALIGSSPAWWIERQVALRAASGASDESQEADE